MYLSSEPQAHLLTSAQRSEAQPFMLATGGSEARIGGKLKNTTPK